MQNIALIHTCTYYEKLKKGKLRVKCAENDENKMYVILSQIYGEETIEIQDFPVIYCPFCGKKRGLINE